MEIKPKKIIILGSTGSIGKQSIEVCEHLDYEILALTANSDAKLLFEQICQAQPQLAVLVNEEVALDLRRQVKRAGLKTEVLAGSEALKVAASLPEADLVIAAISGMAGLAPSLAAVQEGHDLALANKESLVVGGEFFLAEVKKAQVKLYPVDSEHSAIWQALQSGQKSELQKIYLTCSGGPFRGRTKESLAEVTVAEALAHPTWSMGGKISIDSATLMNKGLELIEACRLFGVSQEQIEVLVHPESLIHSMVLWQDNSVIAQLSTPDMRLPIQYALTYPQRLAGLAKTYEPLSPQQAKMSFEPVDEEVFPALRLARFAESSGGILPIAYNGANEYAVAQFLAGRIKFLDITRLVELVLGDASQETCTANNLDEIFYWDRWSRQQAEAYSKCLDK